MNHFHMKPIFPSACATVLLMTTAASGAPVDFARDIKPLFNTLAGQIGLGVAALWMVVGITLISKMSNIKV